ARRADLPEAAVGLAAVDADGHAAEPGDAIVVVGATRGEVAAAGHAAAPREALDVADEALMAVARALAVVAGHAHSSGHASTQRAAIKVGHAVAAELARPARGGRARRLTGHRAHRADEAHAAVAGAGAWCAHAAVHRTGIGWSRVEEVAATARS